MSDSHKFRLANGTIVRDIITGFSGMVVARTNHIHGCDRYQIQPKVREGEDKLPESYYFDDHSLEVLSLPSKTVAPGVEESEPEAPKRGGPIQKVTRTPVSRRM